MTPAEDDSPWQRLPQLALLFLIFSRGQRVVRENLALVASAGAGAAFTDWLGLREIVLGTSALLLIVVVGALVHHRRFRFRLSDDAVEVRQGLLRKEELRVRFARVQNVQLGQPIWLRPFDLVHFSLETPGAMQTEVELPGIPRALAEQMRDRVIAFRAGAQEAPGSRAGARVSADAGDAERGAGRSRGDDDGDAPDAPDAPDAREVESTAGGHAGDRRHGESGQRIWASVAASTAPSTALSTPQAGSTLFTAGPAQLFRHGMASNQLWVMLAVLYYPLSQVLQRFRAAPLVEGTLAWLGAQAEGGLLAAMLLALAIMLILLTLSGLLAVIRYHGYRLLDAGERIVSHAGLLDVQERTLRRDRITGLTLQQSALGRLLGAWQLTARQTRGGDMDVPGVGFDFLVPGLARADLRVCAQLMAGTALPAAMQPVSPRFRELLWLRLFLLMLLVLTAQLTAFGFGDPRLAGPALLLPILLLAIHLRCRHWGWQLADDQLWVRRGFLGQRLDAFPLAQIQQVALIQSPLQRRRGLANLRLTLPQGTLTVPFLPEPIAAGIANRALHAAQTANLHAV